MATLEVHKDHVLERSVALASKPVWVLGRSAESDIQIAHASASRRHARIFLEDGGYYIDDLASTHGTVVAGQPLRPGAPVRLFDGLRIAVGTSDYELVPTNMMVAVMAAMKAAQEEKAAEAARQAAATVHQAAAAAAEKKPLSEAHRRGAALLEGGEVAVAEADAAAAEDEALRAFMPASFGKPSSSRAAVDKDAHGAHARGAAAGAGLSLKEKLGAKKGGMIKMGANLGASLGAGAGLVVPSATPTLAALQEKKAQQSAPPRGPMAPPQPRPPSKSLRASLPLRPQAGAAGGAAGGAVEEEEEEVGPALPPGFAASGSVEDDEEEEVGPPLPPGPGALARAWDHGAAGGEEVYEEDEMGPALPPGFGEGAAAGPSLPLGGMLPPPPRTEYDPDNLSQQVFPSGGDDDDDDDGGGDDDDDGDDESGGGVREVRLPLSHQIVLKGHSKMVTCLATDRAGGRVATGSSDHDVRLWDFGGMTSELKSFRHVEEPLGSYQIRALDFSARGDLLVVAGSSNQPCILDRDGRKLTTLMRGDMYLRDMRVTKGHVASCTAAKWHPSDANLLATASEDGTVRLWDAAVACERDDMSLSVNSGQRSVMVLSDAKGHKSAATSIAWHADGRTILCGARDGSLQLWELRAPTAYQPVVLLPNATPKIEAAADKVKPTSVIRGAHAAESDVSCVRWHRDGRQVASRATDGTLKLWDLRRTDKPLGAWGGLDNLFPTTGCDFSPDGGMLVTGSSVPPKGAGGAAKLTFVSTRTCEQVAQIEVDGASIVGLLWHPRLNQILLGNADGGAYVLYDPEMSEKGALLCAAKAPPKRSNTVYTGGALQIVTPHALPMYKDEELDHRKRRRQERHDPLKSHKPEHIMSKLSTGGRLQVNYQQALLASMPGGISGLGGTKDKIAAFKTEDPREEILKYAKLAAEDPFFVAPAYAQTQPQVAAGAHLAKTVDSDDEEEKR